MMQKSHIELLQSCKLTSFQQQFFEIDSNIKETLCSTHKTPPYLSSKIGEFDAIKTQKMPLAVRLETNRKRLPSLVKFQHQHKEDLLDLDQAFEKMTDKNYFVIKTFKSPSISSQGKQTSSGSNDNSMQGVHNQRRKNKIATEIQQTKESTERGRSYNINMKPCKIVNSKKLPFNLNCSNKNKRTQVLQGLNLDISRILKKEEGQLSFESIKDICCFL